MIQWKYIESVNIYEKMDQKTVKGSQGKCVSDQVCREWDILELQK